MHDFKRLIVWQKAHELAVRIGVVAKRFQRQKRSLASQLERAADAVPAHIAEGRGRATDADFAHFLAMAIGSINEVENHLLRAHADGLISDDENLALVEATIEVRKMLVGLRKRVLRGRDGDDKSRP